MCCVCFLIAVCFVAFACACLVLLGVVFVGLSLVLFVCFAVACMCFLGVSCCVLLL